MATAHYETRNGVAVITLDHAGMNSLAHGVRKGIAAGLAKANADSKVSAIVLVGAGNKAFSAGADVSEFKTGGAFKAPRLNDLVNTVESNAKPVITAFNGLALGGGFELALGTHYRVGTSSTFVGLPEVKLGLLPGAGGTQRLPRLVGPLVAATLIMTGANCKSIRCQKLGIFDAVIDIPKGSNHRETLLQGAIDFARSVADKSLDGRRISKRACQPLNDFFFQQIKGQAAKAARGHVAPAAIIECIKAATELPFEEGMKVEQAGIQKLFLGTQSKALQYVFFAQRQATKLPGIDTKDVYPIRKVGIIGAGTMGGGIAMTYIQKGIQVVLKEIKQEYLDNGLAIIQGNYDRKVKKGKRTKHQVKGYMSLIKPTLDYADLADVDLVIEAVFENMNVKKEVFGELDKVCKPSCILASNTSFLDLDAIAAATSRPHMVIGMHYFSPANIMQLLEVVRGKRTSKKVIATVMDIGKRTGKTAVMVGNCWGFAGNRILSPYSDCASLLLEEGASYEQIDKALYKFGMPMGPFQLADLAGNDIGYKTRKSLGLVDPKTRPRGQRYNGSVGDRLCEAKRYGQKTKKGYYKYGGRSRRGKVDPVSLQIIDAVRREKGIKPRSFTDKEIVELLIFSLINEAFKVLDEGIAVRPSDIDVIYVFGYGFPPHVGGPMHYADVVGLRKVRDRLKEFARQYPDSMSLKLSPLLDRLANERTTLAKYWKKKMKSEASKL